MSAVVEPMYLAWRRTGSSHSGCAISSAPGLRIEQVDDLLLAEGLVDDAGALPQRPCRRGRSASIDVARRGACRARRRSAGPSGSARTILTAFDDVHDHVGHRLHRRRAVDVADDEVAGVRVDEGAELVGRAAVGERAAGGEIGEHDGRSGFRILAISAMKCTPQNAMTSALVFCAARARPQRVADVVGEILDLRLLVVVREDDRVALLLQALDLLLELPGGRQIRFGERQGHGRNMRQPPSPVTPSIVSSTVFNKPSRHLRVSTRMFANSRPTR